MATLHWQPNPPWADRGSRLPWSCWVSRTALAPGTPHVRMAIVFFFQVTVHIHSISSCSSSFDRESGSPAHEGKGRDTDKADAEKRILEVSKIGVRTPYPHLTNTFPANSPGTPASCHPPSSSPRPPWVSLSSTGYKRWKPLLEWTLLSSGSLSVSLGRLSAK